MRITREILEAKEDQLLAPWGMRSRDSKGREHPDKEPQYRTSFQRDRDRILHTTAFRRLEQKTQVFITSKGDYFRTRLTHTLEVAQIGRTLARALGANEDLNEAICLVHDLGHAAFGHSGERTLNALLADQGGFDHNRQSLRIVTKLERRFPNFDGLNLTWEVREGIVKHETKYDESDATDYDPQLRGDLEAQIANVADELAYTTHDLDDGLRSKMVSPEQLKGIQMWDMVVDSVGWKGPELSDLDRHRIIRRLIGLLVSDVLQATSARIEASRAQSALAIQELDNNVIGYSQDMQVVNDEIKDFLYDKFYSHPEVLEMADNAERVLTTVFKAYVADPGQMPEAFQARIKKRGLQRTIADYIAGMTDRFAINEEKRLLGESN